MYFLVNHNLKIIFGWSAKCGCSHIKQIFWYLENNKIDNPIHIFEEYDFNLPDDIENYITILIIRNPYERLISGFLNRCTIGGPVRLNWPHQDMTFSKFVDELIKNDYTVADRHHFTPQLTEKFNINVTKSKELILYDLCNIDYSYIEKIYNKIIPECLLNNRGGHQHIKDNILEEDVYDLDISLHIDYKVPTKYFYNNEIKDKVYNFFRDDFIFFSEHGFDYKLDL